MALVRHKNLQVRETYGDPRFGHCTIIMLVDDVNESPTSFDSWLMVLLIDETSAVEKVWVLFH